MWQHLSAMTLGAEAGTKINGPYLGAMDLGRRSMRGGGGVDAMDLSADPLYTGSTPSLSPSHSSPFPTDRPRLPRPQPPSPTPPPAVPAPSPGCVAHAPSWLRRPRRPRLAAIPAIVIDLRVCVVERGIKLAN
jgi:hypothetical protein